MSGHAHPAVCAGCGLTRWLRGRGLCYPCLRAADPPTPPAYAGAFHHASPVFVPMPWTEYAACAETDPDAFFPEKGYSTAAAKAICAQCTVRAECLDYALETHQRWGVYGGLSERQRARLERGAA